MELTNDQVELAVQAFVAEFGPADSLEGIAEQRKIAMRAAAPFLQLPWDEPSTDELGSCFTTAYKKDGYSPTQMDINFILTWFVRRRNAALAPNPVDPRINAIARVLQENSPLWGKSGTDLAEKVIAALDEKPEPEFKFGFNPLESSANDHMYRNSVLAQPAPPREEFKKNPADMPKDFRRQVIATELCALGVDVKIGFTAADRILAALDEVKL